MKTYLPESVIKASLQRLGFSKRNLPVLARKMKTYKGKEVKFDENKNALYVEDK